MNSQVHRALFVSLLLIALSGCSSRGPAPTPTVQREISPEARAALYKLNSWPPTAVDSVECPDRYPLTVDTGETTSWTRNQKRVLKELGYSVRWNCREMKYEIAESEEPVCDCPGPTP